MCKIAVQCEGRKRRDIADDAFANSDMTTLRPQTNACAPQDRPRTPAQGEKGIVDSKAIKESLRNNRFPPKEKSTER
jgi:hypothetical protein